MNERELFLEALDLTDPAERAAFLDRGCAGDAELRQKLALLLAAHEQAGQFLHQPHPAAAPAGELTGAYAPQETEAPGTIIAGRYKLLEQIGEGGMGTVWVAEQTQPVRRKVALKLIKAGMDSKSVLARFEAERQALAVMDHPNIAKVLDGGITGEVGSWQSAVGSQERRPGSLPTAECLLPPAGRPFFVMEYVKGVPITEYCDATRLSVPERLNLFVQVCQAVQHAHQKGIIHRDLKPSNILVAPYDDKPVPKVIDFGLAKAMHQSLTERTLHTAHETVLGTPLYMSPEQAQLNNLDVDTRSDIYSLGVLLYELLTGTTPLEKQRFKEAAWDEIKRIIREEEPPRPSTRLSSSNTLASLAAGRHSEPAKLTKLVRGELDWIVMKSLEKDRSRRYETANGFAMDVQRYLSGEPVLAVPPSVSYRLRKFSRQHRAALTTAAVIAALLVIGVAVSTWQAVRATRAETAARLAEQDAETRRADAEQQKNRAEAGENLASERLVLIADEKKKAEEEKQIAQAVNNFLQNDLLAQASPFAEPDRDLKLRTVLDRAAQKIEGKFDQQPLVEAAIRQTIAVTYGQLNLFAAAQRHVERAFELRRRHLGEEHRLTLASMNHLGLILREQSKFEAAEALWRRALELSCRVLGEEDPNTAQTMAHLAYLLQRQGKLADAESLFQKVLPIRRRVFGEVDSLPLESMSRIAQVLQGQGKLSPAEAEEVERKVLETHRRVRGNEHPDTLLAMHHLALQLVRQGKLDEAERLSRAGLETARRVLGEEHSRTLLLMSNLGQALGARGDYAAAEALLVKCLEVRRRVSGEEQHLTLGAKASLEQLYRTQRKFDQAEPLLVERVEFLRSVREAEHPEIAMALAYLGSCRLQQQKFAEAEPVLRECLAIREKKEPDVWTTFNTKSLLGGALLGQKKYADAEPLLLAGHEGMKKRQDKIPANGKVRLPEAIERLVQLYEALDKPDEAAKWRKELEAEREKSKAKP